MLAFVAWDPDPNLSTSRTSVLSNRDAVFLKNRSGLGETSEPVR